MDDYIAKPIRFNDLAQALENCHPLTPRLSHQSSEPWESPSTIRTALKMTARTWRSAPVLAAPSAALLSWEALQEVREMAGAERPEDWIEIIDCYLEETPRLLHTMHEAIAQTDAKLLRRSAHSLKSSSATLGAPALASLCQQLDEALHNLPDPDRPEVLTARTEQVIQIETEYQRVQSALVMEKQRCYLQECFQP